MVILMILLPPITAAITPSTPSLGGSGNSGGGSSMVSLPEMPANPLADVAKIVPYLSFVHLLLLPIFAYRKHMNFKNPPPEEPAAELDPDAKTVIFSHKLSCCEKIVRFTFGIILGIVSIILRVLGMAGLDLKSLWFPEPFWNFYNAKLELRSYQIDGCKLKFDARQEDAYLKFQYEAVMNFYTLGLFGMCCGKKTSYTRWLDTKIKWRGAPPPGFNQQFRVFHTKLSCVQKIKVRLLVLLLSPFYGATKIPIIGGFTPTAVIGLFVDKYVYTLNLSNFLFGGSKPSFDMKKFTFCNYVHAFYVKAIFGICKGKLVRWIDSCVVMGAPTFDPEHDADAPEDEPNPDGSTPAPAAADPATPVQAV